MPQLDHAAGQQTQAPASASLRRCGTGQRNKMRFLLTIELVLIDPLAAPIRAERRRQPFLDKALTQPLHRGHANINCFGNPRIRPVRTARSRIGLEQNLRVLELAHVRLAA
jgi:hypothetical protein